MKAKMKKISALFLSCILLFSITACQKKRTAKEVMQSSLKQSSSLKDADFNGNASLIQLKREKRDLNQQLILR